MGEPSDPSLPDRIRSWARHHARAPSDGPDPVLPTSRDPSKKNENLVRTSHEGGTSLARPTAILTNVDNASHSTDGTHDVNTRNNDADIRSANPPPPAPPPIKSEAEGEKNSTLSDEEQASPVRLSISRRMKNGSVRFWHHAWEALTHSWVNVLLIFVPAGIAADAAGLNPAVVFALNAVAIIPLAGLLAFATESVAKRLGDTLGALLNVSFGNAVELIIFIIALVKNEIRIVQASLLGSILSNLLLILGMAFLLGGLRYQEQIYNNTVTQMSACLLSLAVCSLVLPTVFHYSFSDTTTADVNTLKISRATSVVLLIIYVLYLAFQLKSHAYLYESMPQKIIDEESQPGLLAEVFDSSSSSDDTDSDSTHSSDTSGSHTTTKRIKRAFRTRRRRKSSVSSTNTASVPSVISSPTAEKNPGLWENTNANGHDASRRGSYLGPIHSGDEADVDGEAGARNSAPRVRDFVQNLHTRLNENDTRSKRSKKHKKHQSRPSSSHDEKASVRGTGTRSSHENPPSRVAFADEVMEAQGDVNDQPKRPFGLTFTRPAILRPALPKVLSQNVFVSPQSTATGSPAVGATVPRTNSGLRRTSSLPDRLNSQASASRPARAIPPHVDAVVATADPEALEEAPEKPLMSRTSACVMLLITTALVAVCAEFMVDAIPGMLENSSVSQAFIGLIILPIVSNAAEHVTAVTVATKNKMDLAIGVSVGSSIQIALFVTPVVVILGWILEKDMSLYFNLFETVSLFVTTFVVNFLVLDGRSNYLEGSLLISVYVIIAVCAFFYPDGTAQSSIGGGGA